MEKEIEIDGLKIHYDETGPENGLPVLLMHGWGCNHTTVRSIASALEGGMRVINVDLPGHGKSSEPLTVWGIEDYTAFMEKFVSLLNLKNLSLIGHSFGGRISILMSSRKDILKMVLVDSAGIKPKRSFKYYWKVYSFKTIKHLLWFLFGKTKGGKIVDRLRGKAGSADYRSSSPMMRAIMSKCVNEDLKSVMPQIKSPTLLIWGDNDTATPVKDAKIMETLIKDAGLVIFPGCGHYSFLDNPLGFKAVIKEFFKQEMK